MLPRGSTPIEAGDELHMLVRRETRSEVGRLTRRWREGPIERPPAVPIGLRASPQVFSVRPTRPADGDTGAPEQINGVEVVRILRTRPDVPAAIVVLADGRFAVTGPEPDRGGRPPQPGPLVRRARRPRRRRPPRTAPGSRNASA